MSELYRVSFTNTYGVVGNLCAQCHHSSGGLWRVLGADLDADLSVYNLSGHPLHISSSRLIKLPRKQMERMKETGLPYISDATPGFQCTTCHNVHDNTIQPFLRVPLTQLCIKCHNYPHGYPSEPDQVMEWLKAVSPKGGSEVTWRGVALPPEFLVPFEAQGAWQIGGHLTWGERGDVTCVTCHAMHGARADSDAEYYAGEEYSPREKLLVFPLEKWGGVSQ